MAFLFGTAIVAFALASAVGGPPDLPGHASLQLGDSQFRTEATDLVFLRDNKTIVSASWRQGLKYWDLASGHVRLRVRASAERMRMSADGRRLVTQDTYDRGNTSLQIFDADDGTRIANVKWPSTEIFPVVLQAVTNDGMAGDFSDHDGRVCVRDLATARALNQRGLAQRGVEHVAVSPDGAILAISTDSNEIFLWEWQSDKPPVAIGPQRRNLGLAFSPDGKHLAAGGDSKKDVQIFNVETHALERSLRDPNARFLRVDDLVFTPDGKELAAVNGIALVRGFVAGILVWDVETGALKHRFTVSGAHPRRLALSADGKLLAAPMGETLHIWSLATGQPIGSQTTGHTTGINTVIFSSQGDRIVTASDDATARIWDATTGRELRRLDHGGKWVRAAAISPDGTLVATSSLDDKVHIWQMANGKQVYALQGHGNLGGRRALRFSSDGSVLFSWGDGNTLRLWNVATGQLKREFALQRSGTHDGDPNREEVLRRNFLARFDEECSGGCFRNGGKQQIGRAHV